MIDLALTHATRELRHRDLQTLLPQRDHPEAQSGGEVLGIQCGSLRDQLMPAEHDRVRPARLGRLGWTLRSERQMGTPADDILHCDYICLTRD